MKCLAFNFNFACANAQYSCRQRMEHYRKIFELWSLLLNVLPKYYCLFIEHCHDFMVSLACNCLQ